ncbi:ribokinase [Salinibacillus xinjiangensis]|uniref:Ribokinase n=1 Tax=Salinibacillus xinjiangensis TaxID=1229268 RepID=A0A6G1XB20_9BACI|nr:ribokinase [Salinibacillus xinjiangensis]MRG88137.1 ribokinase [Salinibacillus xinjiangensis]
MTKPNISVVGSINMDLVKEVSNFPNKGETVLGKNFFTSFGGKGANQAIASSRLGAEVTMFGCVGDDDYGKKLISNLQRNGVNTENVTSVANMTSGIASITLSEEDNSIIVIPGANNKVTPEYIFDREAEIIKSDLILASIEIPLETVVCVSEMAKKYHIPFVLNPAPATQLPAKLIQNSTLLTPNEHEFFVVLGSNDQKSIYEERINTYNGAIIITRGSKSAVMKKEKGELKYLPSYKVRVVDTTGAGDAFNGAIAYMLAKGEDLEDAAKFAMAVSALAVTKLGAQTGLPTIEEYDNFMQSNNILR